MDMNDFGRELVVWDFKERKPLQVAKAGLTPLEVRWSLKPGNNYGFTNCALDSSLWLFRGQADGAYAFKKVATTGAFPVDLRQSPDDRFLFVSCFNDNLIQQWDVTDPDAPRLVSTVAPGVQPNMMHTSTDGKRMYVTNSLLSTLDHAGRFYVRLVHIGPDGMKVDPFFNIDLNHFPSGPARGHDMLIN
jgi:selenium-binding protein 1